MFIGLLKNIWRGKLFIIYMCILSIMLAFAVKCFAISGRYVYSSNFYVTNYRLARVAIDKSSLDTDIKVADSCAILLKSDLALATLGEMLTEKYGEKYLSNYFDFVYDDEGNRTIDYEELAECIDIDNMAEGVAVLNVKVTTNSPYLSQSIGEFISFIAPNIVYYYIGIDYILPLDDARMTVDSGFSGKKVTLLAGAAAGLIISFAVIFIYRRLNERFVFDRKDILECTKSTELGYIPYYDIGEA